MSSIHGRIPGVLLSLAVAAMLATSSRSGEAPQRVEDPGTLRVDPSLGQYDGARACQRCHSAPLAGDDTDYVALTEFTTWSEKDRHSKAFATLKNERSTHIGKLLGIEPTTANVCLNCHAANVPKEARAETFTLESGVSCDACHGPSQKWFREHTLPGWRVKPMAEKKTLGFGDVRDPVSKTRLCGSCHVGDRAANRFVTHEMYAAGHPPLPGFEVATFCEAMPRHWRLLKEKNKNIQELLAKHLQFDPEEHANSKLVLVGGMVTLWGSLAELMEQADPAAKRPWPELAHYDCYACHHDLKSPSWRQQLGGQPARPGRPVLRRWPETLPHAGGDLAWELIGKRPVTLSEWMRPLHDALDAQPFGRREAALEEGVFPLGWLKGLADLVCHSPARKRIKDAEASRLLHLLAAWPEKQLPDCDSARQLGWAFKIVYDERFPKEARTGEMHDRIAQVLTELDASLMLRLPSRDRQASKTASSAYLDRLNRYDPGQVKTLFQRLKAALPEK